MKNSLAEGRCTFMDLYQEPEKLQKISLSISLSNSYHSVKTSMKGWRGSGLHVNDKDREIESISGLFQDLSR
jgi:hypothetical protein